jgi:cytoskeletal protein RodZ
VPFWRRPLVLGAASVLVLLAVVMVVADNWGVAQGARRAPPLVQADSGPVKVAPENPGGMAVPHQDRLIYDRMTGSDTREPVEQLLPGPEEPVRTPAGTAGTGAAAPAAGSQTASTAPNGQATPPAAVPAGRETQAPPAAAPAPTVESRPLDQPQHAAAPPAASTGSAANAPPRVAALEQPKPSTPSGSVYVQLGAVRDPATANGEWARLTRQMPDLLGGRTLQARRVDLSAKGVYYRLQTGPFASRSDAQHLCDQIKTRGAGCMVIGR